jgi:hypothetical protein
VVRITDTDHGYARLMVNARKLRSTVVRVGVNENVHEGSGGLTNAQIGAFHEFGTATIPQRSFLRAWVDGTQKGWTAWLKEHLYRALMGREAWAKNFGEYAVEGVRARMRLGIPPPLKDATVRRKDHATPLLDTDQLLNAVEYDVQGGT